MRFLFMCVCACVRACVCIRPRSWPHNVELCNYVISHHNITSEFYKVELRNYVISRQNFIKSLAKPSWDGVGQFFRLEPVPYLSAHACQIWSRSDSRFEKKEGGYRHTDYETFTSMSGTILPTMCQMLVVIQ